MLRIERLGLSNERPWHIESFIILPMHVFARDLSDRKRNRVHAVHNLLYFRTTRRIFNSHIRVRVVLKQWCEVAASILESFSIIHGTSEIKNASIASRVIS